MWKAVCMNLRGGTHLLQRECSSAGFCRWSSPVGLHRLQSNCILPVMAEKDFDIVAQKDFDGHDPAAIFVRRSTTTLLVELCYELASRVVEVL